jgi:hypothetical protein
MKQIRALILLVLALILVGCGCGGNEEAVRAMQALPQERLESLFNYAQSLHKNGNIDPSDFLDFQESPVPRELADLNPKSLRFFGDTVAIHLSGCVDDKIYLFVEGAGETDRSKKIVVSLGERKGSEVLWEQ